MSPWKKAGELYLPEGFAVNPKSRQVLGFLDNGGVFIPKEVTDADEDINCFPWDHVDWSPGFQSFWRKRVRVHW